MMQKNARTGLALVGVGIVVVAVFFTFTNNVTPTLESLPAMTLHVGGGFQTTTYHFAPDGTLVYYHSDEKGKQHATTTLSMATQNKLKSLLATHRVNSIQNDPPAYPDADYYMLEIEDRSVYAHKMGSKAYRLTNEIENIFRYHFETHDSP